MKQFKFLEDFYTKKKSDSLLFKFAIISFFLFVTIAIFAPLLANDKPLVCKYKDQLLFPAFSFKQSIIISNQETLSYNMGKEWKVLKMQFAIFPVCAYSPNSIDFNNAPRKSPFDNQTLILPSKQIIPLPNKFWHWLGTTQNGHDVLSCLIFGARVSLLVGLFSMCIASLIGVFLGICSGYYQNHSFKIGYIQLLALVIGIGLAWFYSIVVFDNELTNAFQQGGVSLILQLGFSFFLFVLTVLILNYIGKWLDKLLRIKPIVFLPIDSIISRCIEVMNSIPILLFIIVLSTIAKPSYTILILIIGFFGWTNIARLTRAEYLKAKNLEYVLACKSIGMTDYRIIIKHILPNVIPLILVYVVFGLADVVLIESSLSFIGVGVPINIATWGSLLNEARDYFSCWWLVLFPGICLFALIMIYNTIANQLTKMVSR